jgi:hypothetical protein
VDLRGVVEHALTVHVAGATPARHLVAAPVTAGGSRADGLFLPGAPPAAVHLVPAAAGVVVEARSAGVRVAGHAVHPGARRLLRAGERADLPGAALALEPAAPAEATRAAASPVLRGEVACGGPSVVVLTGPRAGERHALGDGLTAGRGRGASLRVPDPLASRVHLRLRTGPGGATLEDLGSKNGVRVNGVELEPGRPCPVRPGDEIALGDTLLSLEAPWPRAVGPGVPGRGGAAGGARPRRVPPAFAAALLLALSAAALALAGS